jgi:hypothetical protein
MLVRILACLALLGPPAFAGWQRFVDSQKGASTDSSPPHPLAYFMVDPCLRPEGDPLGPSLECTWPGAPPPSPGELERRAKTETDLVEVGKIGAFTIYDLWYHRGNGFSYPNQDLRSVLVKTADDEYREIDTNIRRGDLFPKSEIVTLDGEPILIAKSHDGGQNGWIYEHLYMFRPSGPETPDFSAVDQAVATLLPENMSIGIATNDYSSMTRRVETYRNDINLARVLIKERGRITVNYRFVDGRAVVIRSTYEPYLRE